MNFRYFYNIIEPGLYYHPHSSNTSGSFEINLPQGWSKIEDLEWISITPNNASLPLQGWKLHVSATAQNAQRVLDIVAGYCFENSIPFKYTPSSRALYIKNSKNGNRVACGKFITIYPAFSQLKKTITRLNSLLSEYKEAPYILSDMRFKDGPLYYRYGGFQRIEDSKGKLCVITPDGTMEEDQRVPYYRIPEWVTTPQFLLDDQTKEQETKEANFRGFQVENALHFTTGGEYIK